MLMTYCNNYTYSICLQYSLTTMYVYMVSSVPPGAEPLAVVLVSCLSETINDQLRVGSERSVCTTFMASEVILPSSLHEREQECKLAYITV